MKYVIRGERPDDKMELWLEQGGIDGSVILCGRRGRDMGYILLLSSAGEIVPRDGAKALGLPTRGGSSWMARVEGDPRNK